MSSITAGQVWFSKPGTVELREQTLPEPKADQLLLRSLYSGISAGTELLVYRGQVPETLSLDASLAALGDEQISYPLQYGYASVGCVEQIGSNIDSAWLGRKAFCFQPHASHFLATSDVLIPVPDDISAEAAVFLANMETAVNLLLDARPQLGDKVLVMGQGIVGLLVTQILAQFPLAELCVVDPQASRRRLAESLGATASFDPNDDNDQTSLRQLLQPQEPAGADIVFELSGVPAALNQALSLCAYSGRLVVGSWYGSKTAELALGERFHRNRIELVSSQVSSIAPALSGRWDKARRFEVAWDMIRKCQPEQFISHRLPLDMAAEAYGMLDKGSEDVMQIVFDYQQE